MAYVEQWLSAELSALTAPAFPLTAPQGQPLPIVIYKRTGTSRERTLANAIGLPVASFEINVYSLTYAEAKSISEEIRSALDEYVGTNAGVVVERSTMTDESDDIDLPTDGQSKPIYIVGLNFEVRFQED
jgi:Protein of unknown function (DUF3168)